MIFSVYYQSLDKGEYLRRVVDASGAGQVRSCQDIAGLNGEKGIDVVLLEYQENNPHLDNWITQTSGRADCPEIFLFVEEVSAPFIWKALKLGAREFFSRDIPAQDFQDAIRRVGLRRFNPESRGKVCH